MNELVTSRSQPLEKPRVAGSGLRVLAVEALWPLTVLGAIVWALAPLRASRL